MRQFSLPTFSSRTEYGGEKFIGKRKCARPVVTKRPMHITMRATRARGKCSLLEARNARLVRDTLAKQSKKWKVRVMSQANVGNHLHLLLQAASRQGFRNFLRSVTGIIALKVTKSGKGKGLGGRFWDHLVFSRVVEWGRDLANVERYLEVNRMEAAGIDRRSARRMLGSGISGGRSLVGLRARGGPGGGGRAASNLGFGLVC